MSAFSSVESFATAAEALSRVTSPEPPNPDSNTDRNAGGNTTGICADTGDDAHDREHEKNAGTPSTNFCIRARRNDGIQDDPSRKEKRASRVYSEYSRISRSVDFSGQTAVIDTLIASLNTSETSLNNAHIRRSGAYSLEPLEQSLDQKCTTNSTHTRHSRHISSSLQAIGRTSNSVKSSHSRSLRSFSETDNSKAFLPPTGETKTSSIVREPSDEVPRSSSSESQQPDTAPGQSYPPTAKLIVILLSLYISIFLVALDRTILGPAIPEITNTFKSIKDIGWYGSAYMLTACGCILLYGRLYTFFSTKRIFLITIALFEAGSAICGAATSSNVFILGRAIAGVGSSGIYTGVVLIIMEIVPLNRRPLLQGLFGVCFGVASVAGPLLGGTFTGSSLTWRW